MVSSTRFPSIKVFLPTFLGFSLCLSQTCFADPYFKKLSSHFHVDQLVQQLQRIDAKATQFWLPEVKFSIDTDRDVSSKEWSESYSLRVMNPGLGHIGSINHFNRTLEKLKLAETKESLGKALFSTYEAYLNTYELARQREFNGELLKVLKIKNRFHNDQSTASSILESLKLDEEISNLEMQTQQIQLQIDQLAENHGSFRDLKGNLIAPVKIVEFVSAQAPAPVAEVETLELKLQNLEAQQNLAEEEHNKLIDRFEYSIKRQNSETQEHSFSLMFNLPLPRMEDTKLAYDKIKTKNEILELQKSRLKLKMDVASDEKLILLEAKLLAKQTTKLDKFGKVVKKYKGRRAGATGVHLKEELVRGKISLLRKKLVLYRRYINWLRVKGTLAALPLRNFLHPNLKEVQL